MAFATSEAESQAQIVAGVKLLKALRTQGSTDLDNLDAYVQAIEGEYHAIASGAADGVRSRSAAQVSAATIQSLLRAGFLHWGRTANLKDEEMASMPLLLRKIRERMAETTGHRVASRQFTYGSVTATPVSGGGDGRLLRLTKDQYGFDLEAATAEAKVFECDADATSGADQHEESFEVSGAFADRPPIIDAGSGLSTSIKSQSERRGAGNILVNGSFESYSGAAAAPTAVTGWSFDNIANVLIDLVNFHRTPKGAAAPAALRLKTNVVATQVLSTDAAARMNRLAPYYPSFFFNRQAGSGDGDLKLEIGSKSKTITMAAQTGWNAIELDLDKNLYFENFNQASLSVKLTLSNRTTGYVLVDTGRLCRFVRIDGLFYLLLGGATPHLVGDRFTVTDSVPASLPGKVQREMWQGWRVPLPPAAEAPSTAATSALAGAGAGNVDNGAHSWKVTFVPQNSQQESAGSAASNATTVADKTVNGKVALTSVPLGLAGTVSRKIYRTVAGDTGDYKLVGTIADNTTTTFEDNVADASLGAVIPKGNAGAVGASGVGGVTTALADPT